MGHNLIDGLIGGIGSMVEKVKEKIWEVGQKIIAEFKSLVSRKIKDARFIQLLWKFLKAGYLENWQYHATHSSTPAGRYHLADSGEYLPA